MDTHAQQVAAGQMPNAQARAQRSKQRRHLFLAMYEHIC